MRKILKNKLVVAALMFLLIDMAGAFLILAPFMISVRNIFDRSAIAREFWPAPSVEVFINIIVNHPQILAVSAVAAFSVYLLFAALRALFSAGIYRIIIEGPEVILGGNESGGGFTEFLKISSQSWMGFLKVAVAAIVVYTITGFFGVTVGQVFMGFGVFWGVAFFILMMIIGSTYTQVLRIGILQSNDNSVVSAMKSTRQIVAKSILRFIIGNLSVVVIGALICLGIWMVIGAVRGGQWSGPRAVITIVLEQLIVMVVCLMQAIRINYNNAIIKRGSQDAVGGTELGGV